MRFHDSTINDQHLLTYYSPPRIKNKQYMYRPAISFFKKKRLSAGSLKYQRYVAEDYYTHTYSCYFKNIIHTYVTPARLTFHSFKMIERERYVHMIDGPLSIHFQLVLLLLRLALFHFFSIKKVVYIPSTAI